MNYLQKPWSIFLITTGLSLGSYRSKTLRDRLWKRRWVTWAFPDYPACVIVFTVQHWAGCSQGSSLKARSSLLHSKMDFYALQMSSWESCAVYCSREMEQDPLSVQGLLSWACWWTAQGLFRWHEIIKLGMGCFPCTVPFEPWHILWGCDTSSVCTNQSDFTTLSSFWLLEEALGWGRSSACFAVLESQHHYLL